jgi:capsular polysaccharide biosynthesis protein
MKKTVRNIFISIVVGAFIGVCIWLFEALNEPDPELEGDEEDC